MKPERLAAAAVVILLATGPAAAAFREGLPAPASPAGDGPPAGDAAHPPPRPEGAAEAPDAVRKVTTRVLCMCGTCVNQTLHECTCGTAAMERDRVAAAVASGKDPEAIIQAYVDEYGLQVLSTPDRTGFNLLGWSVPFIVSAAALGALAWVLRGWVKAPSAAPAAAAAGSEDAREKAYRDRLERELKDFEA